MRRSRPWSRLLEARPNGPLYSRAAGRGPAPGMQSHACGVSNSATGCAYIISHRGVREHQVRVRAHKWLRWVAVAPWFWKVGSLYGVAGLCRILSATQPRGPRVRVPVTKCAAPCLSRGETQQPPPRFPWSQGYRVTRGLKLPRTLRFTVALPAADISGKSWVDGFVLRG